MNRDVALRIDGMLMAVWSSLDGLAHYVKNNCTEAESKRIIRQIGAGMGETIDIEIGVRADFRSLKAAHGS